jgi:hypothetical protein
LPTGGAGGGGSLRGRSAAAAALSIAKDAPIAVRSLSIINPLCLNRIFPAAPVRSPLMLVGSGVHRCTFTNALAETIAQQESSDAPEFPRRCGAKVTAIPEHPHIRPPAGIITLVSRRPCVSEACFSYLVLRGAAVRAFDLSFPACATPAPAPPRWLPRRA